MNNFETTTWDIKHCDFTFFYANTLLVALTPESEKELGDKNLEIKSELNLKNLFSDLVSRNNSYGNPPLFNNCDLSDDELILMFFSELKDKTIGKYTTDPNNPKKKTGYLGEQKLWGHPQHAKYRTNFLSKKDDNRFFTSFFWETKENGYPGTMFCISDIVGKMEERCEYFINRYSHHSDNLNTFLNTFIKALINEISKLNKKAKEDNTSLAQKQNDLFEYLKVIKDNNVKLLARLIIIAAFRFEKMTPTILYEIVKGKDNLADEMDDYSDIQYVKSLFSQNVNDKEHFLKQAYGKITKKTKCAEQIMLSYGKNAYGNGFFKEAFAAFTRLTSKYDGGGEGYRYLAYCYENGYGCEKSDALTFKNYTLAAELEDSESLIWLSNKTLASNTINKDKVKTYCQIVLKNEEGSRSSWYGKAAFILATLSDNNDEAIKFFKLSAESGYVPAVSKVRALEKKKRVINEIRKEVNNSDKKENFFFTNCNSINENVFKEFDFKDHYVYSIQPGTDLPYKSIVEFLHESYDNCEPVVNFPKKSIFALCSEDETQNINDTLLLLDYLYNKTIDIDVNCENDSEQRKDGFVESIEIFVSADYSTATMLIDASLADMGGEVYFKVHVFDKYKATARWLLSSSPLFVPSIAAKERNVHLITLGNTPFIYSVIKEAVSCCYMSTCDLRVTAFDSEISVIENRFKQEASGLYAEALKKKIMPDFSPLDLYSVALEDAISGKLASEISDKMKQGNYFVVDVGSDFENIRLARRLRTYLLRNDESFKRFPFIAVRVSDSRNAYLAERLTVGNKAPNNKSWFNNYGLCVFSDCMPSFDEANLIEKLGLNIHLSYYGNDVTAGKRSYYTYSYNVDSSEAAAVGLIYKMFDCDVIFENISDYSAMNFNMLKNLAAKYDNKIKKDGYLLKQIAAAEQTRFNCYLLANGWRYARPEQVFAYMAESKSTSHKQELAKLHPFLFDFEDFAEGRGEISKFEILKSYLGVSNLKNPKESTESSVKSVLNFFAENECKKEISSTEER